MQTSSSISTEAPHAHLTPPESDEGYEHFLSTIQSRFDGLTSENEPLFTTDAEGVFDAFLAALPSDRRQHYECRECRNFVTRFGGLVTVSPDGTIHETMWSSSVPGFFQAAVNAARSIVRSATITGVFLSIDPVWGTPSNESPKSPSGEYHHMHVRPRAERLYRSVHLSADQRMAEMKEESKMLRRGLEEFPLSHVRQAHTLLTTGQLYRSEKCIGVASWLLALHESLAATRNEKTRDHLIWRAVAMAPAGFAHVRTTMIGTLLEDIAAELPFADIKRKFDAKMDPMVNQRPQAPPTAGNIRQAEALVEKLKSAGSLARRFARIEEVKALWTPPPVKPAPAAAGVFGHLFPKTPTTAAPGIETSTQTLTFRKFRETVLPIAQTIEFYVPAKAGPFFAFVTAVDPTAPPILQWDLENARNPVSWYFYRNGSEPSQWGLRGGTYVPVSAVCLQPTQWGDETKFSHQGAGAFFVLKGAKDSRNTAQGFFPECLRAEYHGVRATLEAYVRNATLAGREDATACGVGYHAGQAWEDLRLRVTTASGVTSTYRIDRWD